jgi:alpha-amylase
MNSGSISTAYLSKRLLLFSLLTLTILFISSCTTQPKPVPVAPITGLPEGTDGCPWWNDTVFYEVFVRSYMDSDGDGNGDINGLISKLDYLNDGDPETTTDLGVTGLWLMPISPSPSYHGYDVTDYYDINPQYGTLDDFKRLLDQAHQRGIRVIIDFVMNHTSSQHPWFQEARDPNSPRRNWYIWADKLAGYKGPWGQDVWYPSGDSYYYAIFYAGMPDLNYTNPEVREEMEKAARFWLQEVGVDGFRLDAAKHIIEEGQVQENTLATHAWWEEFHQAYKAADPQSLAVGEIWSSTDQVAQYLEGDELDLAFNFDMAGNVIKGVNEGSSFIIRAALESTSRTIPPAKFATFLTNHDQNRLMTQLGEYPERARAAAAALLTLPGVPFVYYGEEIGMTGMKPDENLRTPMQWSADANGGFSTAEFPWKTVDDDYLAVNVALQASDPASLLNWYGTLIQLRNNHAALRVGEYIPLEANSSQVLAFLRVSQGETLLICINLGKEPASDVSMSLRQGALSGSYRVASLLDTASLGKKVRLALPAISSTGGFENYLPLPQGTPLPGYASLILQLQPVK